MADRSIGARDAWPTDTRTKVKDLGDGDYAIVVSVEDSTVSLAAGSAITMQGQLTGGGMATPRIDDEDHSFVVIDETTYGIHKGTRYIASYLIPHGSELANDASQDVLFITGNIPPHIALDVAVGGNCDLLLYENPTITDNGTSVIVRNKNRQSTNTAVATFWHTPTVGATGSSLLLSRFVPGGTGPSPGGGMGSLREPEWVFNAGTTYLFRLTNRSGAAIMACFTIEWDED